MLAKIKTEPKDEKTGSRLGDMLLVFGFLTFIAIFLFLGLVKPDVVFSEDENRNLAQLPKFDLTKLVEGKLTLAYEKYVNDQFPGRSNWISFKSRLEWLSGKKDTAGVFFAEDDYLLQKLEPPADGQMEKNLNAMAEFFAKHPNYTGTMFLIPTSTWVLQSKLPKYSQIVDEAAYAKQVAQGVESISRLNFAWAFEALSAKQEEYIYYKTDHHYTTLGAYYAYVALGDALGYTPLPKTAFKVKTGSNDFYGTLYSKGIFNWLPTDSLDLYLQEDLVADLTYVDDGSNLAGLYDYAKLKTKDKYSVFLGGNFGYIQIKTNVLNGKTLNVVKDSFAHALIPFLANHYQQINVFDLRYFRAEFDDYLPKDQTNQFLFVYNMASYFKEGSIAQIKYQ